MTPPVSPGAARADGIGIRIRDARPADCAIIVEFNRRLALETERKVLDLAVLERGVTLALAEPDRLRYWVAEIETTAEIVGQAAVTREWSDWRACWIWWFQSVYVTAPARGRGVFRALYGHIHGVAVADAMVKGLRLYVEDANAAAKSTYTALGMRPAGYSVYENTWLGAAHGD